MIVIPLSPSPPSSSPHREGPPNQAFLCNRRHILELFYGGPSGVCFLRGLVWVVKIEQEKKRN